ncbi:rhomboid family intramembrane serine protease [Halomonas sp. MCCC 1A17488]|uniref:Rhomboid family intramembrane serine protease n=1 Tax=Billgrantia sulfidoxydans TaxID=2733484 RepID=A0ABX7W5X1_9GAMM|nr:MULTISPECIES: rhomboid family intramembrane serine protease [Halomonas]MCE8014529.1 rhomboid family intramembrane serine protease [Halomonas sp. MCCC 1A17488]MCG3237862.1 rhomboid family intramembrane serine protease [Halomonas sp. MCCC 1A17488]QPP48345.1 rhomboid family intramembrane serine protease [Halomonas sp. SS10-MC5]QTP55653.1 rhomboid family intramembrane serine protease [Halomonas sulfidoxydans]
MYRIMLFPHETDTSELRRALWAHRIGHRFTEEAEGQVLWLADPAQHDALVRLLTRWQRGERIMPERRRRSTSGASLSAALRQVPVTTAALGISLLVFALMGVLGDIVVAMLTIVPVAVVGGGLAFGNLTDALASGQVWRLLSPAFLHFGWMHLIFNMMWLWYFGRQVETLQGSGRMLTILLVAGVGANLAQYATGTVLFGGMSGVDFALLGYVWLMSRRAPHSGFFVPQMLVVFMLGWMVFTMTDMAGAVGFGNVANEAHLGGLVVGLLLGWYYSGRARRLH